VDRRQPLKPITKVADTNERLASILCGDKVAALDRFVERGSADPGSGASLGDRQGKLFHDCLAIVDRFDSGGQARVPAGDGELI
jgi:hypothetical protein